ncbi:MAG: ATP-binding cassette domain-containing protein [Lachnospiraceae bacterium]
MKKIIEVSHLSKSYGNVQAVKDISFDVEQGKLFAFLGPNGAGKSTTINSICTFLKPDKGEVLVNGYRLGEQDGNIRDSIGVVFQESVLDGLLTVEENLSLRGSFYNLRGKELKEAVANAAVATEIGTFLKRPYGKLSGGQRRRADIARALLHTPKILFLDEPTTGLDPQTRKNVWDTIKKLQREQGMTVFLTTHYMEEAEEADYCVVVDNGMVAAKGTPFELKEQYAKDKLSLKGKNMEQLKLILEEKHIIYTKKADLLEIELQNTMDAMAILKETEPVLDGFTVVKGSMDDVFLGITGKEIRE